MSSPNTPNTKQLAEIIANLLAPNEAADSDFQALRASIEKINERLSRIENSLPPAENSANEISNSVKEISNPVHVHPSQEKYNVIEAIVDEIFENQRKEKTCTFEPNGKSCDHCSMCNSRGF